jgi:hypothetical protein
MPGKRYLIGSLICLINLVLDVVTITPASTLIESSIPLENSGYLKFNLRYYTPSLVIKYPA